jgi:hypothetical protein
VTGRAGGASDPAIINRRERRLACTRLFKEAAGAADRILSRRGDTVGDHRCCLDVFWEASFF